MTITTHAKVDVSNLKIINWPEAMNQVGNDKEFLDEVLADLLTESDTAEIDISNAIR